MSCPKPVGPLLTDLYELTMAAGYFARGITAPATFSLYARSRPQRSYFVAAGLESVLTQLEDFRFAADDLDYLAGTGLFDAAFLAFLADLRFDGSVRAMAEGTVFFADEPILEITAPLIQAQLLETFLINAMGFASLAATKAARCIHAARSRQLIDFALRRTQGADAGMIVARSTYLAGFAATSNVLAGKCFGIPVAGTMAHSFVMAFDREIDAFRAYADTFPDNTVLLVDTYDPLGGVENAITVGLEMAGKGQALKGIRLDSGDMVAQSRQARAKLDAAGLTDVRIFASGGFDEQRIASALGAGAMIDAFGVGTRVGVSADAPYMDMVYKMVRFDDRNVRKLSAGKQTLAGEKQVWRELDDAGLMAGDRIGLRNETPASGRALLTPVMENGRRCGAVESLDTIRQRFAEGFAQLPAAVKRLQQPAVYPVTVTPALVACQQQAGGGR